MSMSLSTTFMQERNASYRFVSFLEQREVPVITTLESFYPNGGAEAMTSQSLRQQSQANAPGQQQKVVSVKMTLDSSAYDITK
mmetsp:Transcript_42386/g.55879  ORF Transcript_42386/g.55879 Transcript_42386/m.55879 type:complete len:83 (+) Transcript_42386:282-530(+)